MLISSVYLILRYFAQIKNFFCIILCVMIRIVIKNECYIIGGILMVLFKESKKLLMHAYKDFTTDEGKKFLVDLLNDCADKIETEMHTLYSKDHVKLYDICFELEQMRRWGMISFEKNRSR